MVEVVELTSVEEVVVELAKLVALMELDKEETV